MAKESLKNRASEDNFRDSNEVRHYQLDKQRPFIRSERESTTILFGGLPEINQSVISAAWQGLGYNVVPLSAPDSEAYQLGREHCNTGMCNPAYYTVGNLLKFIRSREQEGLSKEDICSSYVYLTAGSFGPCRFGMYQSEFRWALKRFGYPAFRIIVLQQKAGLIQSDPTAGLEINIDFCLSLMYGFLLGDLLHDVAFKLRPYELEKGATDKAIDKCLSHLGSVLASDAPAKTPRFIKKLAAISPGLSTQLEYTFKFYGVLRHKKYIDALKDCYKYLQEIRLNPLQPKPLVRIVGEFWAQRTEGAGNFDMFKFLEKEGAEVALEPLTAWMMYLLHQKKTELKRNIGLTRDNSLSKSLLSSFISYLKTISNYLRFSFTEWVFKREWEKHRRALNNLPSTLLDQYEIARAAKPFYDCALSGGEGHLESGINILSVKQNLAHLVLSLKPFGCLPSTQSDAVQAGVVAKHPGLNFLSIETGGDSPQSAYSRVQMSLAEARLDVNNEFEKALKTSRHSKDALLDYIEKNRKKTLKLFQDRQSKKLYASRAATTITELSKLNINK